MTSSLAKLAAAAVLSASLFAAPASAHHSAAMYDNAHLVAVEGDVKDFNWVNPHVSVDLEVAGKDGQASLWAIEASSPGVMTRAGWTKHSLQPGDHVIIEMAPLRNGGPSGSLRKVTFPATGKVLTWSF